MRTHLLVLLALSACVAEVPNEYSDFGSTESELTASERRARAAQIRDAASAAGMTQGWMLAGIAQAETGLAHCWSEATWACRGPNSPDCGGGPVIAGSGDGACSLQQGGLGLFQFDGGTFSQTLARDGNGILSIDGNVTRAVSFVTNMVKNSSFVSGVSTDAQAIEWMNGVRIDNARWDAWISTVVRHYNGCRTTSSCWASRYASYRDKTRDVFNEMGSAFWSTGGGGGGGGAPPPLPAGPSIRDIANRGACSTAGAEGLSAQLAEAQRCMNPGAFVRFAPHPGITLTSDRVHPYAQASARDALHRAAASRPLSINSAFRTVADQYVLYHSGGCGLAAAPGRSNHQSGRAVDVGNHASVRSTLEAQGCRWLGSRDPVHFDCPGTDQRNNSVRAFQALWNVNNPGDIIVEDGLYGNQTGSRLAMAPAGGFTRGVCDDEPTMPMAGSSEMRGVIFAEGDIDERVGGANVRVVETGESVLSASADGAWSFSVPDGTYTLEASASGFATTRQSCIVAGDVWCSIEMTRGAESSDGTVAGQLFADDGMGTGAPITTGQVIVTETGLRASPDASGLFALRLPAGRYTLVGSAEGFASVTRSCVVSAGRESTCSLGLVAEAAAQELVGVVFTQGDIFTRVVNARVRILETDAETTSREGDGLFLFNVAPGVYTVEVSGPGIEDGLRVCTVSSSTTWCSVGVMRNGDDSFGVGFEETNDEGVVADLDDLERANTTSITGSACSASAGTSGAPTPWMLALTFIGAAVLRRRR